MDAEKHLADLSSHLQQRGYKKKNVEAAIQKGKENTRQDLLTYNTKKETQDRVPLVLTYDHRLARTSTLLHQHMPLLHQSDKMKRLFTKPPLVAFRRSRNLKDLLVSSKLPRPSSGEEGPPGFTSCPSRKCSVREFITEGTHFTSTVTNQRFTINTHIHCKMNWLIYLITCKKCNKQYVGKTENTLYTRFTNHKSDIKFHGTPKSNNLPIGRHFTLPDHSIKDISIMGIEKIHKQTTETILRRESYWILKLQTLHPKGINVDC